MGGARANGLRRQRGFKPPYKQQSSTEGGSGAPSFVKKALEGPDGKSSDGQEVPARYKGLDPALIEPKNHAPTPFASTL